MPFRFVHRVLHTPETYFSLVIGLLVTMMICLGHPPNETDPNATNRLCLHLIEGVVLIALLLGCLRVWFDNSYAPAKQDAHFGDSPGTPLRHHS